MMEAKQKGEEKRIRREEKRSRIETRGGREGETAIVSLAPAKSAVQPTAPTLLTDVQTNGLMRLHSLPAEAS